MGTTTGLKPDSMIYDPDNDSFYRAGDSFGSAIDFLRATTGIDYPDYAAKAITDAQKQDYINSLLETDRSLESPTEYLGLNQAQSQAPLNQMVASMRSVGADDNTVGNLVLKKDNEFQDKVAAIGGVNKDTLGAVIDAAQQTYGEGDSRAVATVVSEAFKAGLQMKDLAEAAGIEEEDVVNAARTAAQDPNKALSLPEMGREAVNTVFEVGNKVADLVEAGLEKTGIEKVVDTVGNTVAKIIGLDPSASKKVAVFNPTTGQVTVQASNVPGGGIIGKLPQSPYVPIGTTSGGTTYGVDMENAVLNTVLGKVLNNKGLEEGDITSVIAAGVEDATGIPMEVAGNVIDVAGAVIDQTGKIIKDSGILNVSDDNTGTTLTIDGQGGTNVGDTSFENIMGPIDTRTDAEKAADAEEAANRTYTSVGSTQDLLDLIANSGTGENDGCPEGQERDKNGNCYTPGVSGRTIVDDDLTVANVTANTPCDNADEIRDPVTLVCGKPTGGGGTTIICPDNYRNAGDVVSDISLCGGLKLKGTTITCPDNYNNAGDVVSDISLCGGLKSTGGQTKVCETGTLLAGQTVDINTDCGTLGGKTKVCPDDTKLAGQTVDINTDCGTLGGKVCPAGQTLNLVTNECEYAKVFCGEGYTLNILTGQCEKDTDKEETDGGILTLPTPNLKVPGRGDFVTADDVLVKNLGDVGGIYSILPAPVREPFLADRRQQDIRNVADVVGIRQGQDLNQDPFAVERFARYANAFDIGVPELLDISGVLPSELPLYEEKFGVQFPEVGIQPPVRPEKRIAEDRYDPTSFVPTAMADGGVVKQENGIESLLDRRQQAVNRMLAKRAGTYFGQ